MVFWLKWSVATLAAGYYCSEVSLKIRWLHTQKYYNAGLNSCHWLGSLLACDSTATPPWYDTFLKCELLIFYPGDGAVDKCEPWTTNQNSGNSRLPMEEYLNYCCAVELTLDLYPSGWISSLVTLDTESKDRRYIDGLSLLDLWKINKLWIWIS